METLVEFPHADGTAGVYRDRDGIWLSGVLGHGGTRLEGYQPSVEGLLGPRTAQAGRLPPGAVGAEVVDDLGERRRAAAGDGAWVIVLEQPTEGQPSPVRFFDPRGETVARPIPDGWRRTPVADAGEPCPACGASTWDEVEPLDESRGMHAAGLPDAEPPAVLPDLDWQPNPFVRCRTCGYEEPASTWFGPAVGTDAEPADAARLARDLVDQHDRAARQALSGIDFMVYVPEGLEVAVNGWGGYPGVDRVTVTHSGADGAELSVETSHHTVVYAGEPDLVLETLEGLLRPAPGDFPRAASQAAMTLWLEARERENRRERRLLMAGVEVERRPLVVDGAAEPFAFAATAGRWAAVRRVGELMVVVSATGVAVDDVRLVRVADPLSELLARH